MAEVTTQQYISREPDWMEAYRRGLIEDVKEKVGTKQQLAEYKVAGPSEEQQRAVQLASAGIGAYKPYLSAAQTSYQGVGAGADRGAQTAREAARQANQMIGQVDRGAQTAREAARQANQMIGQAKQEALPFITSAQDYYRLMGQTGLTGAEQATTYGARASQLAEQGAMAYDPYSAEAYMNPFQQQVIDRTMAEMRRQAAIQGQNVASQAVRAGAYGGSRFGVQQAELARNLAETQGNVLSQQYAQNYSQAQQAAMQAFQNQQARTQQAAQTALGAGSLASGGAFNLAGLQGSQASGIAGLGAQTFGMGQVGAQTALSGGQLASGAEMQAANLKAQTALSGGQLASGAEMQAAGLRGQQAAGLANLGQMTSALGQGDVSFLYNIGQKQQAQTQAELDAKRANIELANKEPYQRLSYYADILNRTPSGTMGMTQTSAPSPSLLSQVAGAGIAGLGAYNTFMK